ncbi:MAG: serine/threonine-protein kinase, partial [Stackebrandtia sp.]
MGPGRMLGGRYELAERIGAGGMGEVWRATDTKLRRAVAVKVLHSALAADQAFRRRFIQEAHTLAAVNQPGVVNIFDAGDDVDEAGQTISYLVMEFVSGRPLSRIIDDHGPLPPDQVLRIVGQVAYGLDAAHRAGIVHRDVKPANILIDKSGDATILDFGIARRDGDTGLTTTGAVMGTVEYASPEQLQGHELTGASDVYSLGVVAYESVSRRRPFDGESVATVIAGHLNRNPPPLPPHIPDEVAQVISTALEKNPRNRFGSAAQFGRACRQPRQLATRPMANPAPPSQPGQAPLPP